MAAAPNHDWGFITSHAAVLLQVDRNPHATVREIAVSTGLTERQVHRVLADLVEAEYVVRRRSGRRNEYSVTRGLPMRRKMVAHHQIDQLLEALSPR
jgi:DNA-binding MarR family transcriptional regulator